MPEVNCLQVFLASLSSMVLGSLWYGPIFGKPWMKMMGMTKEGSKNVPSSEMSKLYGIQFVGSVIMAFALSQFPAQSVFIIWAGFVAPVTLGTVLWEGKPWKLWFLNNGYYLTLLYIMSFILSLWN